MTSRRLLLGSLLGLALPLGLGSACDSRPVAPIDDAEDARAEPGPAEPGLPPDAGAADGPDTPDAAADADAEDAATDDASSDASDEGGG